MGMRPAMSATMEVKMTTTSPIDVALFTDDEHAVVAHWLRREPVPPARGIAPEDALERLGFARDPSTFYTI